MVSDGTRIFKDHQFVPHLVVLLPEFVSVALFGHDVSQLRVFFFQHEQLLVEVVGTAFALEVQDVLKVRDLLLKLDHERVICCADLICACFCHNLLRAICKLQGRDCFFRMINHWTDSGDQCRSCVAAKRVLEQSCDL